MQYLYFVAWAYIAWRINSGLKIRRPYNIYVYACFLFLALISTIAFAGRNWQNPAMAVITPLGYIGMGFCGIMFTSFILNDILNLINLIFFKIKKFRYWSTLIILCAGVLASVWALLNAALILQVKEVTIKVPDLPVESLRIVELADLHITKYTSPDVIKKIFSKAEGLKPDIIVIAGDVFDTNISRSDLAAYGFEQLKAPYGIFAVTGNHERRRMDTYLMLGDFGIKALKNESVLIDGKTALAGINDSDWKNAGVVKSVFDALPGKNFVLFLSHRPETFDIAAAAAAERGINIVQLSAHTHAGQIPPAEIVRKYFMKYNYGLYRIGNSIMYVTSGARWWGPPMRLGNRSEIAVITLERQ